MHFHVSQPSNTQRGAVLTSKSPQALCPCSLQRLRFVTIFDHSHRILHNKRRGLGGHRTTTRSAEQVARVAIMELVSYYIVGGNITASLLAVTGQVI